MSTTTGRWPSPRGSAQAKGPLLRRGSAPPHGAMIAAPLLVKNPTMPACAARRTWTASMPLWLLFRTETTPTPTVDAISMARSIAESGR